MSLKPALQFMLRPTENCHIITEAAGPHGPILTAHIAVRHNVQSGVAEELQRMDGTNEALHL